MKQSASHLPLFIFATTILDINNETINKNKPIFPFPLSPPCPTPFLPQTFAIAIAIAISILIIKNQPPIPLFSPIPFVAHKFSGTFSSNIKRII
jgi:hypothetical protein